MCCIPAIGSSSLPGQGSSASGAGNIPLTQFPLQVSLLELHWVCSSANPAPSVLELAPASQGLCGFSLNMPPGGSKPPGTKHRHSGCLVRQGFTRAYLFSEHSAPPGAPLLGEVRGPVSTRHPRYVLSRRPEGGGCDGGSGVGSGSGRTCDSGGLQSEVGCPGPSPRHGCLRPPPLTRGRCCREGSRCLPAGSWCCNLGKEQHSLRTQSRLSRRLGCTPVLVTLRCQNLHATRC